ncbi:MAG: hypothetical protein DRP42_03840 [Tenericutes bacterium]|nr:MAG: hypothetical protein DRP42_03840 [Mycoplasmatota bacterium]
MKSKLQNKDLKIEIGTKKEVAWTRIRDNLKQKQMESHIENIINKEVIKLCEEMIKKEKNI